MHDSEIFFDQSRRAFWNRILGWVTRRGSSLVEFSQAMHNISFGSQRDLGLQIVPVKKIVGTVGRGSDFDRDFLPRRSNMEQRWMAIQQLLDRQGTLPVLELYKVGDSYFVVDGHHRVSVARANGVAYLDARVIEVSAAQPQTAYAC